jgi:hypothetical protein
MAKKQGPARLNPSNPEEYPVTSKRAEHVAKLAGVDPKEVIGQPVGEVNELLKWKVDPSLLLFRRICGRVVKIDPVTGQVCPVPNATVHVQDTDCSFLGLFPKEPPFFWLLPLRCSTEVITTVRTDACGRFCVYLPFWDIDRILRFRKERVCFPDLIRPRLVDILELLPDPPVVRDPRPLPDPPPFGRIDRRSIEALRGSFGDGMADRIEALVEDRAFGESTSELQSLLQLPAPRKPAPLPQQLRDSEGALDALEVVTKETGLGHETLPDLNRTRFIGPFVRCRDVYVPEWVPILDVPDITFRVTQDVDGDGTEEEIYSEGFFDVRWNSASIPNVTLEADASAICVPMCDPVDPIPCTDEPVINTAGYMSLDNAYHDDAAGFGRRVNRPAPPVGDYADVPPAGSGPSTAVSPYARTLNLHGCHRIQGATHYRFTYSLNGSGVQPMTGISWFAPRDAAAPPGPPIHVVPDPDGWYPILATNLVEHDSWLLSWPTHGAAWADGTYELRLEVGTMSGGSMSVIGTSDPRTITTDNKHPDAGFLQVRWRYESSGTWNTLPTICPVITRDGTKAIRVQVAWHASADHLRDARLTFIGCGAGNPELVEPPPPATASQEAYQHWHVNASDNAVLQTNEYRIPVAPPPGGQSAGVAGCYTLTIRATGRGFNPSGFDYGPALDWWMTQVVNRRYASRALSLVNV